MKRYYVSVDPGKHACGVAVWDEDTAGQLIWAGYVKNHFKDEPGKERAERWGDMAREVVSMMKWAVMKSLNSNLLRDTKFSLILEIPQVYEGPQDEDRNDLIDLAGVQGAVVGAMGNDADVEWSPQPREWKGQIPKEVTQKRVDKRLSAAEQGKIEWPAKSLKHNVYDALHMGLVFLEKQGIRSLPQQS